MKTALRTILFTRRVPVAAPAGASVVGGGVVACTNATTYQLTYSLSGLSVGDVLCLHFWDDGGGQTVTTQGGAGSVLTAQSSTNFNFCYSFTLASGDFATPGTTNRLKIDGLTVDKAIVYAVIHGVSTATEKVFVQSGGTTITPLTFTPSGGFKGALITSIDSGGGSSGPNTASTGTWTFPYNSIGVATGNYYFGSVGLSLDYAGGTLTESGFGTNDTQCAHSWELT